MITTKDIYSRIELLKRSGITLFPNLSAEQKRSLLHIEDDETCKPKQGSTDATA